MIVVDAVGARYLARRSFKRRVARLPESIDTIAVSLGQTMTNDRGPEASHARRRLNQPGKSSSEDAYGNSAVTARDRGLRTRRRVVLPFRRTS
jgi:hypothetical protein